MKRVKMVIALLMCSLVLSNCTTKRIAVPVRPDQSFFVCEAISKEDRPLLPKEYFIDWDSALASVQRRELTATEAIEWALTEHKKYVVSVRARENKVIGYVVLLEGQIFMCANNMQALEEFFADLP